MGKSDPPNKKNNCCGCAACAQVCPENCITMESDSEGFLYPCSDKKRCKSCGLCKTVCLYNLPDQRQDILTKSAYGCVNKNSELAMKSSSSGIFSLISEFVFAKNGAVCGAGFDNDFKVIHKIIESEKELDDLRRAKYVQSEIGEAYTNSKAILDSGKYLLFSGTPCQITGLKLFLRKKYDNLVTLDIACHGVPSPKVYYKYIEYVSGKYEGQSIKSINFRNKDKGWTNYSYNINFDNGIFNSPHEKDAYSRAFLKNIALRPSCYVCKAHRLEKFSDITAADYWGVQNIHPELYSEEGVSLVIVNSKKGSEIFDYIKPDLKWIETDIKYSVNLNPCIFSSVKPHRKRPHFFKQLDKRNISDLVEQIDKKPFFKNRI